MKTSGRSAFTLVELLTVIAIVGVLVAIIIPVVASVRASARSTLCLSNLRQIGQASALYSADKRGDIVPPFDPSDSQAPLHKNHWTGLLAGYIGRSATGNFNTYDEAPVFICPDKPGSFGYGHNYNWLSQVSGGVLIAKMRMTQAANPANTVLITDQYHSDTTTWRAFVRPAGWGTWNSATPDDYTVSFRHRGDTCNVVWLDGHVSSEKKTSRFATGHTHWRLWPGQ